MPLVVIKGLPVSITERIVSAPVRTEYLRSLPDFIRRTGPSESTGSAESRRGAGQPRHEPRRELLWLAQQVSDCGIQPGAEEPAAFHRPKKRREVRPMV
ncbi:MAG: hypothetical protein R3F46_12780 [bacterium]